MEKYNFTKSIIKLSDSSYMAQVPVKNNEANNNLLVTSTTGIIISFISLSVSIISVYISNFRKPNIKLYFGRNIILFPTLIPSLTNQNPMIGIGFHLPVSFHNWSHQGGTVQRIRLIIGNKNDNNFYDMTWTTFSKIINGGNFEDENLAQPIAIAGKSSLNKIIRFDWSPDLGGTNFNFQVGVYDIKILVWTNEDDKPSIEYPLSFVIKDEDRLKYKNSVNAKLSIPIWFSLSEKEKPNQFVPRDTIDRLYSKK